MRTQSPPGMSSVPLLSAATMPGRTKTCLTQWSIRMIEMWPRRVAGRPGAASRRPARDLLAGGWLGCSYGLQPLCDVLERADRNESVTFGGVAGPGEDDAGDVSGGRGDGIDVGSIADVERFGRRGPRGARARPRRPRGWGLKAPISACCAQSTTSNNPAMPSASQLAVRRVVGQDGETDPPVVRGSGGLPGDRAGGSGRRDRADRSPSTRSTHSATVSWSTPVRSLASLSCAPARSFRSGHERSSSWARR